MKNSIKTLAMWLIIAVILIVLISSIMENTDNKLAYSELISKIEAGEVKEITLASDGGKAEVKLKNENFSKEVNIPSVENLMNSLSESMKAGTVKVTEKSESLWMVVFSLLTPFGLLIIFFIFWFFLMGGIQGGTGGNGNGKTMSFGKSRARMINPSDKNRVTFDDVAGVDEEKEELEEIVEFLKNPRKFTEMGARIPKGVLLVGHPGTGKTLLAKAVAGEAGVPFFFISGSDFVEMFVGVGASRVRDLFEEAKKKVIDYLEENKIGTRKVNYKLRDWVFSRQRYWGEPIPMVHCDKCGWVPLPEEELPLCLPDIEDYEPGENGESPLAKHTDWVNTTCPHCGGKATRETDTMPQWAGSSWYYLRYMDAHNDKALASKEALEYWSPVDWYNGGMEHTTLHLLYSRFWHKFLYDIGVVPTKEPYQKRTSHGMILGSNGEKMSKSKGNVINPDDIVEEFGADTFRVYEMFMGPFDQTAPWSMESIRGCNKFLDRVWNMQEFLVDGDSYSPEFEKMMHKAIKKVSSDIEEMKFNTAVSTFMTMTNEFYKLKRINKAEYKTFLQLLNPFAPHMTEELFEIIGAKDTIANTLMMKQKLLMMKLKFQFKLMEK